MQYFTDDELKCKCGCGALVVADGFETKLHNLRVSFGLPMIVTSCCRCPEHNKKEGGAMPTHSFVGSYHLTNHMVSNGTCAIDIKRQGYDYDAKLISIALATGWSVGIAKTFIHLDRRIDYGQPAVIYFY